MMLLGFGPLLVPWPRTNAAWFVGLFIAAIAFAILVLLLVVGYCGDRTSTEPFSGTSQTAQVTADCYPFCGAATTAERPG